MSIIGTMALGALGSSLFGGGRSSGTAPAPAPVKSANETYKSQYDIANSTLQNLFKAQDTASDLNRKRGIRDVNEAMQRRNMRSSGVHQQAMDQLLADLEGQDAAARNAMALDVFKALDTSVQSQLNRDFQSAMANFEAANNQSAMNQSKRGNIVSGILNLGASAIGLGGL